MDSEIDQYPTHITEAVNNAVLNLLPEKSRKVYDGFYQKFKEWHVKNGLKEIREEVLLAYFFEALQFMVSYLLFAFMMM